MKLMLNKQFSGPYTAPVVRLGSLRRAMRCAAELVEVGTLAEVSLLLTDDPGIAILNDNYRGKAGPTDVLSFPQEDALILGDIVISLETSQRQAESAGWPLSSEVALLATHGLLHLTGYIDDEEDDAQVMEELTRTILRNANIDLPRADHPFFQSEARR